MAPTAPSPNAVLYALAPIFGPSGVTGPPTGPYYEALYNSGFTTVVLWTLFVHSNGDVIYGHYGPEGQDVIASNGTFNANYASLQDTITALKQGGSVQLVLFSIGTGTEPTNAWTYLNQLLLHSPTGPSTVRANFQAIMEGIPALDGFDFDVEDEGLGPGASAVMAEMAKFITDNGTNDMIITFCPTAGPDPDPVWAETMQLIAKDGPQPVLWWNLQAYGPADLAPWVDQFAAGSGVPTAQAAKGIVPGLGADPAVVQQQLASWKAQFPALDGGFIWNSTGMRPWSPTGISATACADAIINGVSGVTPSNG